MNLRSLSLAAALSLGFLAESNAAITDSATLLLGFRATGGTGSASNLVVDLGTAASLASAGYSLDFSSAASVISTTYGASWWNRNDLYWGLIASDNDTLNLYLSRTTGTALPAGSDGTSPNIAAQDLYTINGNVAAMAAASTAGNATYSTNNGHIVSVSSTGNAGSWTAGQSIGWGFFPGSTDVVVSGNTNLSVAYYTWNMDDTSENYGAGNTPQTPVATLTNSGGVISIAAAASTPTPTPTPSAVAQLAVGAASFAGTNAVITGGSTNFTVTVSNSATAGAADLVFTGSNGTYTTGTIISTTVAAGSSTNVGGLAFIGTNVGTNTGAFTIEAPTAAPTTTNGSVSVVVYDHASGSLSTNAIVLSNAIVGYSGPISTDLVISNGAGFRVALQSFSTSTNTNLSLGNVSGVATNGASNAALNLASGQGTGTFTNTIIVTFGDSSLLNGANTNLSTTNLTVTGAIYGHSSSQISGTNLGFASVHVGFTNAQTTTNSVGVTNAAGFRVALNSTNGSSGNTNLNLGSVSNLAAGVSTSLLATLSTNQGAGAFTNKVAITFSDASALLGYSTNNGTATIQVNGLVYTGNSYWTQNGSGNWTNFGNWNLTGGTPGLDGDLSFNDTATFDAGGLTSGTGVVTLNTNASLAAMTFSNNAASYAIAGSGTLTLQAAGYNQPAIIDLAGSHSISNALSISANLAVTNAGGSVLTINGPISGSGNLTKLGDGTLLLYGSNTYSGSTTIGAGILNLGNKGYLNGTTSVAINGGTLLLGAANQIKSGALLTMAAGSRLSMGGNGVTRAASQTLGALTLTGDSTIDFSNLSGTSTLSFSSMALDSYKLTILDWSGTNQWGTQSSGDLTHLNVAQGGLLSGSLANISFFGTSGQFLGTGAFSGSEIVPVPEPVVALSAALLLGSLFFFRHKKLSVI